MPPEQDAFKFKRDSLQHMSFDSQHNFGPSVALQIVSPAAKLLGKLESLDAAAPYKRKMLQRAHQIEHFQK